MRTEFLLLLTAVAPVFLMITTGYAIRRAGWLTAEADASLMRVIVNLLYPCLIIETLLGNRALAQPGNLLLPPLVGFVTVAVGYVASYFAAPIFGLRDDVQRRTFAFATGIYNYGYVPLPLVETLFDSQTTAVLFVHNIGVEIALWTVGLALLSRGPRPGGRWRHLLNPPVLAILAAIVLHFAQAEAWLPAVVSKAMSSLGATAVPLGLILTGAAFADQLRESTAENRRGVSIGSVVLRLGVLPLLMIALARWLPCSLELRRIIVVQAAMPCAVVPVILAKHYGGAPGTAMRIVLVTTALGVLTIPTWLQIGIWWALPN